MVAKVCVHELIFLDSAIFGNRRAWLLFCILHEIINRLVKNPNVRGNFLVKDRPKYALQLFDTAKCNFFILTFHHLNQLIKSSQAEVGLLLRVNHIYSL